jgi:transglutaminase-like putative cysteine protease
VIVGIIATTLAAADVAEPIGSGYWAIPMSITGSIWSYFQRRKRNIGFKFLIAMGMLWGLANFLSSLVNQTNDTRLILAELLIQLQALHCFDLPRRKDLGYSMVIGLILLGVAATLSQTLVFAPFLILFLAIALPVMVLDYRSRLGLGSPPSQPRPGQKWRLGPELAPRRLALVLVGSIVLGLTIFACLPRLPGYQLRSFPVSAQIESFGDFNNQQINNPGYVSNPEAEEDGAEEGTGTVQGSGGSPEEGPGEVGPTYYYGFNTKINQNLQGQMEPQVVMRVRSQAEGFWRVMAFDHYTGQGWEVSRNDDTTTLVRSAYSYRFLMPRFAPLQRFREVVQTYTIVTEELPNLVPALDQPTSLYFPTRELGVDPEGGIRAPVELTDGITYTVVSAVPYRDRTAINAAEVVYPESVQAFYLQLPESIRERVRQRTEELLAQSPQPLTAPYEKTLYLAQALKQQYLVRGDIPFLEEGEDLVEAFLFKNEGGYPDHFSTTLTVMLRSIGIPARLVVGYGPGEFNPFTGLYVVRNTDAYAMTEVYFPDYGWFSFDPIPGHDLIPPSIEESYAFSTLKKLWLWAAGWLPTPLRGFFSGLFLRLTGVVTGLIGALISLLSRDIVGAILGLIILTALGFGMWLLWSLWQFWRDQRRLRRLPPMENLYQRLLRCLRSQGLAKAAAQTPLEYAQGLQERCPEPIVRSADQLVWAYVAWRYGEQPGDLQRLKLLLAQVEQYYRRSWWEQVQRMFKRKT